MSRIIGRVIPKRSKPAARKPRGGRKKEVAAHEPSGSAEAKAGND